MVRSLLQAPLYFLESFGRLLIVPVGNCADRLYLYDVVDVGICVGYRIPLFDDVFDEQIGLSDEGVPAQEGFPEVSHTDAVVHLHRGFDTCFNARGNA